MEYVCAHSYRFSQGTTLVLEYSLPYDGSYFYIDLFSFNNRESLRAFLRHRRGRGKAKQNNDRNNCEYWNQWWLWFHRTVPYKDANRASTC
jgi:hypothetical protein